MSDAFEWSTSDALQMQGQETVLQEQHEENEVNQQRTNTKSERKKEKYVSARGRHALLACPVSKAPGDVSKAVAQKCPYKGRGFKCMTDVKRHIRNQHSKDFKKCIRCCLFFLDPLDLELHERSNTCTREGIQKGLGQEKLWKALYAAMYPGKAIPESPYYPLGRYCSPSPEAVYQSEAQEVNRLTEASPNIGRAHQHRQAVINLIDILRNNIVAKDVDVLVREEATMINLLHSLPPLIKQTSPPAVEKTPLQQHSSLVLGPTASEKNIADVWSFQGKSSLVSDMEALDQGSGAIPEFSFEPTNESFNDFHFPDFEFEGL